jgi:ribosomal protein L37AE/L43A
LEKVLVKELGERREIRKEVFAICCPFCGKYHYKMLDGHGMFTCDKCKRNVEFIVKDERVTMFAARNLDAADGKAARNRSLGCYASCL